MASQAFVYAVVKNIPKSFRSCDLRNFFSQFTERGKFCCFHFRHRPQKLMKTLFNSDADTGASDGSTQGERNCCFCVVKVDKTELDEFIKLYNNKHWVDREGDPLPTKCIISKIASDDEITNDEDIQVLSRLKSLPELHPPAVMPKGNVGTPLAVFLDLIRSCRLPPAIIRKLKLEFPIVRGRRKYSSVPYNYGGIVASSYISREEPVLTASGHELFERYFPPDPKSSETSCFDEENESDEDSSDCEDWERHEALHDDVTQQERIKERLYEEEIELQWEKGGSGLVFYTDAQYWDAEEGDFDAKTADDWDVDMSGYYEKNGGDKDARDYLQMRREQSLRNGTEEVFPLYPHRKSQESQRRQVVRNTDSRKPKVRGRKGKVSKGSTIGKFEHHTKGIGRKILEKYGWKDGEGLGHTIIGLAEALENDGQHPRNKTGFGYHGEKLNRFIGTKRNKTNPSGS